MSHTIRIDGRNISKIWLARQGAPKPVKNKRPTKAQLHKEMLRAALDSMVEAGMLYKDKQGRYGLEEWRKKA